MLLNSSAKVSEVSEQLSLLALKFLGGIYPNVIASFVLRFLNLLSISDKEASLKKMMQDF